MARWRSHKITLVIAAFLLICSTFTLGSARAATDPADLVPKDCLFCVKINNLDNALGQVDMFLTGLFPMGVSMMAKMQMGQFLGSPQPQGVNTAGEFAIFAPVPGSPDPTAIGILVPVSSYQTFVSQNPNVGAADAQGLSKIGPAGQPMLVAREFEGYALISPVGNEQALVGASKPTTTLGSDLDAAEKQRATTAPIWAYGNIQSTGQMFGPMLKAQLGQMQAQQGGPAEAISPMLDSLLKDAKCLTLALTPSVDKISLGAVVTAMPGSEMAQTLQARTGQPDAKLATCLSDGACINILRMETPLCEKLFSTFKDDVLTKLPEDNEEAQKFGAIAKELMASLQGSLAVSLAPSANAKPPVTFRAVSKLKDTEAFGKFMDTVTKALSTETFDGFTDETGMKLAVAVKEKVQTYKGVAIDAITFNMTPEDASNTDAQEIRAIVGDGINIQTATTDGMVAVALAENPSPVIQDSIDKIKAGTPGAMSAEVKTAMGLIPGSDKADLFVTLNVIRLMQIAKSIAPNEVPLPAGSLNTQSNVAIAGAVKGGKASLDLAVPKQHVQEIMMIVMQMQQGM